MCVSVCGRVGGMNVRYNNFYFREKRLRHAQGSVALCTLFPVYRTDWDDNNKPTHL